MQPQTRRFLAAVLTAAVLALPSFGMAQAAPVPPEPGGVGSAGPKDDAQLAAFTITREEAIAIARRTFAIPDELGEPNVSTSQSRERAVWQLSFQTPRKEARRISISVEVDGQTGHIERYNYWSTEPDPEPQPLSISYSEARKAAEAWLDKLAADLKDSLRPADRPVSFEYWGGQSANYEFRWDRMAEGYPVVWDGVRIAISAQTGDLLSFHRGGWEEHEFHVPTVTLSRGEAEQRYLRDVPLGLQYRRYHKPGTDEAEWRLVYAPLLGTFPMMSLSGKPIDYSGAPYDLTLLELMQVVPASDRPYEPPAEPLSREQALAVARQVAGRTDEPTRATYNEAGEEAKRRTWRFVWEATEDEEAPESINVVVDVDSGVVLDFDIWDRYGPEWRDAKPTIGKAEARAMAIAFIQQHRPDLAGNIMLMPHLSWVGPDPRERPRTYSFSFRELRNDIVVNESGPRVEVDAAKGRVRAFWSYGPLNTEDLPEPEDLVSAEEAMRSYLEHQGLELAWVRLEPTAGAPDQEPAPRLVWRPRPRYNVQAIDAATGALLDYQGRDVVAASQRPTDIDGHFAQREIELLWARGIFELKDGKFYPDREATAADIARWLVLSRGIRPYATYDFRVAFAAKGESGELIAAKLADSKAAPYFGAALQSGIILPDDFTVDIDPDSPVSRELFALWAVRSMGYGAIARMPNRIEMPFADRDEIDPAYANAVALLHGLGVVAGDEATAFEPGRAITRGEAAQILFAVSSHPRR